MIRRTRDWAIDLLVAALVGGWWSPVIGIALLAAIGYIAGVWAVLGIAAVGIGAAVWSARQLPERWRFW